MILLLDNGSRRAESILSLRRLATMLSTRVQQPVQPVSLQHSDAVAATELDGQPAPILEPFLTDQYHNGHRHFLIVPLFFGASGALTRALPACIESVQKKTGRIQWFLADPVCPLPAGDQALVTMLAEQIQAVPIINPTHIILVDHGSPVPEVTAVRHWLRQQLAQRYPMLASRLDEAAMERRPEPMYDFNGSLLAQRLECIGQSQQPARIILAMLFFAGGRHAGSDGDIATICCAASARYPQLQIVPTALVGQHPNLVDLLERRLLTAQAAITESRVNFPRL
jgi:sirohydrochlorin ferrochelatase